MISRLIVGQSPQKVAVVGCGISGATLAGELCAQHPTATCHIFDMGPRGPGETGERGQHADSCVRTSWSMPSVKARKDKWRTSSCMRFAVWAS